MTKAGKNSIGRGSDGVSADVFKFGGSNIGSISDGSFATGSSCGESGKVSGTSNSDFGSVLDGLWWSPNGNGFQMAKAGNDSIGCGSDGVSADVFKFSSRNVRSIWNGSFTTSGSGVSGQMLSTGSSHFRGEGNWLRNSPANNLQRWKSRNDSVSGSCGRMGPVMFDFSGPDFRCVQNGTGLSPNRNGLSGDHSGSSGGSVSSGVRGPGGHHFGRFLNGRRLGGVRIIKEGIVIETSRELGRDGACHQNDNDSHL